MPSNVAGVRSQVPEAGGFRSRGQRSIGPNGAGLAFPGPVSRGHLADAAHRKPDAGKADSMAEFTFAPLTPASFLDRSAAVFADRIAIIDGERTFTYRELSDRCRPADRRAGRGGHGPRGPGGGAVHQQPRDAGTAPRRADAGSRPGHGERPALGRGDGGDPQSTRAHRSWWRRTSSPIAPTAWPAS